MLHGTGIFTYIWLKFMVSYSAVLDPEKKSLNSLFSLLNIRHPKKFKPFSHWPSISKYGFHVKQTFQSHGASGLKKNTKSREKKGTVTTRSSHSLESESPRGDSNMARG